MVIVHLSCLMEGKYITRRLRGEGGDGEGRDREREGGDGGGHGFVCIDCN